MDFTGIAIAAYQQICNARNISQAVWVGQLCFPNMPMRVIVGLHRGTIQPQFTPDGNTLQYKEPT